MANVNNPFGLKPLQRTLSGGAPQTESWSKLAAYAAALYKWDPVTRVAGYIRGPASGITPGTTNLFGVSLTPGAISTLTTHLVIVSPDSVFEAQGDGSTGSNVVAAKMGYNANLLLTTAGGGITRDNSGTQIDESTIAVTSTLDVHILGLVGDPSNAYGANARLQIKINKHLRNPGTTQT